MRVIEEVKLDLCKCGDNVSGSYHGHYHKYLCLDCGIETRLHDFIDDAKAEWNMLVKIAKGGMKCLM